MSDLYRIEDLYNEALDIIEAALQQLDRVDTVKLAVRYEQAAVAISQARRLLDIPIRRKGLLTNK